MSGVGSGGPFPLESLACQFLPTGPSAPTFEATLASIMASYSSIYFGNALAQDFSTQDVAWLTSLAQVVYDLNQALIADYQSRSPATAQGVALSSLVKINGLRRQNPTFSTAPMTVIGQAFLPIPAGIIQDEQGNNWDMPFNQVIPITGELDTTVTCEVPGAITAAPGTITNIQTIIPGWQSASNPEAATPGAPVEGDSALRQRQAVSTSMPAQTPRMAIEAALGQVAGVQRCRVFDNPEDTFDANGIPGHSIAAVVAGGQAYNIAAAIASKKGPGTGTFGTASMTVVDQQGMPNTVAWFPLTTQQIYIALTIQTLPGYSVTTAGLISAALAYAINNLAIGAPVTLDILDAAAKLSGTAATASSGLSQPQLDLLAATYIVRTLYFAAAPNPNFATDVAVPFYAAAATSAANIAITTTTTT